MIQSHFESKLNHTVQRASPFQYLCGFQNDGIFRVPSRALFNSVEMLIFQAFPLFLFCENRKYSQKILTERGKNFLLGFVVYFKLHVYYIFEGFLGHII